MVSASNSFDRSSNWASGRGPTRTRSSSISLTATGSSCYARTDFEVERLAELYAPPAAKTHSYYKYVTAEWARKWPVEEIWAARKGG